MNEKKLTVPINGGKLVATVQSNPNAVGIEVSFIADIVEGNPESIPHVLVELADNSSQVCVYLWNDPTKKEYVEKIILADIASEAPPIENLPVEKLIPDDLTPKQYLPEEFVKSNQIEAFEIPIRGGYLVACIEEYIYPGGFEYTGDFPGIKVVFVPDGAPEPDLHHPYISVTQFIGDTEIELETFEDIDTDDYVDYFILADAIMPEGKCVDLRYVESL